MKRRRTAAFTLIELMIVIVIIGILLSLILIASMTGVREAERRATQSLITKLDAAINDRMNALMKLKPYPTNDHLALAGIVASGNVLSSFARAQVWADYDLMRREMPDVWFMPGSGTDYSANYPVNFGMHPYSTGQGGDFNFLLPLGIANMMSGAVSNSAVGYTPLGAAGASFGVASGFFRQAGNLSAGAGGQAAQVGYLPAGYDMIDNNGNGLIDELLEGSPTTPPALPAGLTTNHTHITARAEMLYAILVEGVGPLGSAFDKDDFTTKEVADTDGDGLMEFVDAWGQPLQFFRWPIYYISDSQKGSDLKDQILGNTPLTYPYTSMLDPRQLDPLDPNQQLVAPGWWSSSYNQGPPVPPATGSLSAAAPLSACASTFQYYFINLIEPLPIPQASGSIGVPWDRGGSGGAYLARGAFYSRPLILSGGPDETPGVAILPDGSLTVQALMAEGFTQPNTTTLDAYTDDITNQDANTFGGSE